jgi:type IV pilus assembly protein PilP
MNTILPSRYIRYAKVVFCLLISNLLISCTNDDFSDLDAKINEIKARPKIQIEPLPETKVVEPFAFDLDGSRDPFQAADPIEVVEEGEETPNNGIHPDPDRPKEDLELYTLDTLKMVGTLKKNDVLWALVQSKEGTVHRVKVGNYMGASDGKIVDISENEIKLMEIVPDKNPNTWREQPASLKIDATQ